MRSSIAAQTLRFKEQLISFTRSLGVAELGDGEETAMLEMADAALYQAKQTGRNRVCAPGTASVVVA